MRNSGKWGIWEKGQKWGYPGNGHFGGNEEDPRNTYFGVYPEKAYFGVYAKNTLFWVTP